MGQVSVICNTPIQGRYKLKVYRSDGELRLETPWFDNLITDNGMNQLASSVGLCTQCYIGRGGGTPAVGDTQLQNLLSTANSVNATTYTFFDDGYEPFWRAYKIFTFDAGNATGDIREVGCGFATNNLFSRSLVYGVEEVPTTITVLPDEKLEVYYERRNYISKLDHTDTFAISGSTYTATVRASNIGSVPDIFTGFGGGLSGVSFSLSGQKFLDTVYTSISGASAGPQILTASAYVTNSHYIDYVAQFDQGVAVFAGGIGTGTFQSTQSRFKFLFTPYILKTSSYRLRLEFRHTWSRYVPAL